MNSIAISVVPMSRLATFFLGSAFWPLAMAVGRHEENCEALVVPDATQLRYQEVIVGKMMTAILILLFIVIVTIGTLVAIVIWVIHKEHKETKRLREIATQTLEDRVAHVDVLVQADPSLWLRDAATATETVTASIPSAVAAGPPRLADLPHVFVAKHGECFHYTQSCAGLRSATTSIQQKRACQHCYYMRGRIGTMD